MLTFTFFYTDDNLAHGGESIGTEQGYSARSAYLHLTGRDLTSDVIHAGVWYHIEELETYLD